MADDQLTADPDLYQTLAGNMVQAQKAMIDEGLDQNPDDAAQAMQLGGLTNTPPEAILADQEGFKENQRRSAAQQLVLGNPDLVTYLQSHPMAASVSNDDWGNLDKFTRESSGGFFRSLTKPQPGAIDIVEGALKGGLQGAIEGWKGTELGLDEDPHIQNAEDPSRNTFGRWGAAAMVLTTDAADLVAKAMGGFAGGVEGAAGGAGEVLDQSGVPQTLGRGIEAITSRLPGGPRFWGDYGGQGWEGGLKSFAEYQFNRGDIALHAEEGAGHEVPAVREQTAAELARPYFAAGEEPPANLHPEIDAAKSQVNAEYVQKLSDDLANAMASPTRERSSELFSKLTEQMYGDSQISIGADAALALYGDKLPEEGDNLLGWVPGIQAQIMAARDTGADVAIPIKDWMAKVDPEVAKGLAQDTRVWPGGITAREVAEPIQPRQLVETPLALWRGAMSSEPKFSMGDRKLTLEGVAQDAEGEATVDGPNSISLKDENGEIVGDMRVTPGPDKTLTLESIDGKAGMWANSFGPGLVRDIKGQLKAMYPDHDYIAGPDGARIPLEGKPEDMAKDHANTLNMFEEAYGRDPAKLNENDLGGWVDMRNETEAFGPQNGDAKGLPGWFHEINNIIDEFHQQFGMDVKPKLWVGTSNAFYGMASSLGHIVIRDNLPREDALNTAMHEFGHVMEFDQLDKATPELQKAIRDAWQADSVKGKTVEQVRPVTAAKYNDKARTTPASANASYYGNFHEWFAEQVSRWVTTKDAPVSLVDRFFKGIADLWQKIYDKVTGHTTLTAPVDEFLNGLWRGDKDVPGAAPSPVEQWLSKAEPNIEGLANLQAASVGMPVAQFQKLKTAIQARAAEDLKSAMKSAEKEQQKRQGAEWKANRVDMAKDVSKDIHQRPDIAADLFIGSGELYGKKVQQRFTLNEGRLTPEQRAALPDHYVSKNGLDPDHVAGLFGYRSGEEMVDALAALNKLKVDDAGKPMRTSDFVRKLVQTETDRRMEAKYGNLSQNVMDAAQDQALSDSSINVMYEELTAAAQAAGVTVFDKGVLQDAAKRITNETTLGKLNSFRSMQDMGKHGRRAEAAMLEGKWGDAAVHMQRQTLTAMVAAEAKKVEKEVATFDKVAKRMAKREVKTLPAEYTNWVHTVLGQIGKTVKRSPEDLAREIDAAGSGKTLQEFVEGKNAWLQPVAVWDQLYDPKWQKGYKDLTVEEFRNARDSVKSLMTVGRDEGKVLRGQVEEDFAAAKSEMVTGLQQFEAKVQTAATEKGGIGATVKRLGKGYLASSLQFENFMSRWDKYDAYGPWTQFVVRPLMEAVNQSDAWKKEFAAKIGRLKDSADLTKAVANNVFRAPKEYGGHLVTMTRKDLRGVLLNIGNDSNLKKFAEGWGATPEAVHEWAMKHADKSDFDFAQGVWDMLGDIGDRSADMYRSLSGVPAERIEPRALDTPHGKYAGGYYPVIYHEAFARVPKQLDVGLTQEGFEAATPPAGYTKSRTNFVAPMSMNIDRMPNRLSQMVHDTAVRPAVLQAAKFFRDKEIRAAMTTHYGKEYTDMMVPWLRGIANAANVGKDVTEFSKASEFMRQNLITALVGFNPGTVLKHAPTAAVLSIKEVGGPRFLSAVRSMFTVNEETGDSNWKFATDNSLELQRRDRNWQETLYGATGGLTSNNNVGEWRQKIMQWSSKPVALSDMMSAVPTWLARYDQALEEGRSHGDAVFEADRSVRRAHGSTSVATRPMLTHQLTPWLTSVYNFFNDVMNRQVETVWKAGEALDLAKSGQKDKAMAMVPHLAAGVFAYAIWPALVENWVSPQDSEPEDGWGKKAAKGMAQTLGASWVGVRDLVNFAIEGGSPDVGLASTEVRSLVDAFRDLQKKQPFSPQHAGKLISDASALVGSLTGVPDQIGREARFGYGLAAGTEHPQGPWGWLVGARYGTTKGHSQTAQQYLQGQYDRSRR